MESPNDSMAFYWREMVQWCKQRGRGAVPREGDGARGKRPQVHHRANAPAGGARVLQPLPRGRSPNRVGARETILCCAAGVLSARAPRAGPGGPGREHGHLEPPRQALPVL
jgi:hypothetical protein